MRYFITATLLVASIIHLLPLVGVLGPARLAQAYFTPARRRANIEAMGDRELRAAYDAIRVVARRVAGGPGDILPRVQAHESIYLASGGNHVFPLIALHGALWAYDFFEVTGRLGEIISYRYFFDEEERKTRHAMLNGFAEGFKSVNREVFVDTFTNYHFTRSHGREPGAEALLHPDLLAALNEVHAATARGETLDDARRKHVFQQSLRFEQEVTVAPGIARELAKFDCPILRAMCLRPIVRFAYFPSWRHFFFSDFSDTDERIARALRAFDLAASRGWDRVHASMGDYRSGLVEAASPA